MDCSKVLEKVEGFITEKVEESGSEGLVIGLSGGIDSALTTKIASDAIGSENVTALIMPGKPSKEENMQDARELADELGVETMELSVQPPVEAFEKEMPYEIGKKSAGNIRARSRMIYSYMVANEQNLLVLGASNRTEFMIGYFTKHGDGATDIAPLLDLYKTEVRELARHVGLDEKFIEKQPTAGLWEGQTDEGEIGVSYEEVDKILKAFLDEDLPAEKISDKYSIEGDKVQKITEMYRNSRHKRKGVQGLEIFDERN